MASGTDQATVDWAHADVRGRRLTVPFAEEVSKDWAAAFGDVLKQLAAGRDVEIEREGLAVEVEPGAERDVRHLLEAAVLEANARLSDDDDEDDDDADGRDPEDAAMTETFRTFTEPPPPEAG